jgi:myosin heavy subunit
MSVNKPSDNMDVDPPKRMSEYDKTYKMRDELVIDLQVFTKKFSEFEKLGVHLVERGQFNEDELKHIRKTELKEKDDRIRELELQLQQKPVDNSDELRKLQNALDTANEELMELKYLFKENSKLKLENGKANAAVIRLTNENYTLSGQVRTLTHQNETLKQENATLKREAQRPRTRYDYDPYASFVNNYTSNSGFGSDGLFGGNFRR